MRRALIARFVSACALAGVWLCQALAQGISPSTLNINTDVASATVHTVVHLTASLQTSGSSPAGSVTFLDGTSVIASVPLNSQGVAVLGVASLAPGNHTLSASFSGDSTHVAAVSGTVAVAVTGLPAPFTSSAAQTSIYANQPVTLTTTGLPAAATGFVSFVDGSTPLTSAAIVGTSAPTYQAFGDGITSGQTVSQGQSYPSLFAQADGFSVSDFGVPNSIACDVLPFAILANGLGPSQTSAPVSSVMVGTTDLDTYGSPYLGLFTACDQAALAWLAIPREYKVFPGDPGATVISGAWTADASDGALLNTTGAGALQFGITSNGGPVYLWYGLADASSGSFTLTIDGIASGTTSYSTQPVPAIGSLTHSPGIGVALVRLPLSAGPHILGVDAQSGTVSILGAATPPSPGAASVHPTVLVSDIPNQLTSAPTASPALIAAYTQAIQSSVAQFQADGLDVRLVPTQQWMLGTAAEMSDPVNPNSVGQSHLAQAVESSFGTTPTAPYAIFTGSSPAASVTFSTPGPHTVLANYSGDSTYAAGSASPVSITVLPQSVSVTSLSTQTTSYPLNSAVALTATVTPASATGAVSFYDGTALLTQVNLAGGTGTVTTNTLALGLHQLTAVYNGDAPDASSASPALTLRITPGGTSITLNPFVASAAYGSLGTLTASVSPVDATGTVIFQDSLGGTVGQAALAGGIATVDASSLAVGSHMITASYSGDASHLPSASNSLTVDIHALSTTTTLAAQPAQVSFGAPVSLVATISPAPGGGSVTFRDAVSGVLGTATVNAGSAILNTSALSAGLRSVSASYSGDLVYASSLSAIGTVAVSLASSSVTLAALPPSINTGTSLNLTATVTPATATGTLTFRDPAAGVLGQATVSHGAAFLLLSSLPAGSYLIHAEYSGDADDGGSSSLTVATQVVLQTSAATLMPIAAPLPYSTPVPLVANVSPADASGIASFYDGTNLLGQAPLVSGQAVFKTGALGTGPHQLQVAYGGSAVYAASTSSPTPALIIPASTVTTLSLAEVNVPLGGLVVFNVRVSTLPGSKPSGTVVIRGSGAALASGPLVNMSGGAGYATLSVATAALGFGTFGVTAYYSGDGNNSPSDTSAAPVFFNVVSSTTVTSLSVSSAQVPPQTSVTLTASVRNPSPLTATGAIEFLMNGAVLVTVPLDATGSASTKLPAQPVGSYSLSALYVPSGSWDGSVSGPQSFAVTLPVALVLTPTVVSMASGASTTATLGVTPLSGYSGSLQAQCVSSAPFVTCSVDLPLSVTAPVSGLLHLSVAQNTLGASLRKKRSELLKDGLSFALLLPVLLYRRRQGRIGGRSLLALCTVLLLSGCANGGDFGTIPPGRQLVVVSIQAAGTTTTAGVAIDVGK